MSKDVDAMFMQRVRLSECLRRLVEAEHAIAFTRQDLSELCSEIGDPPIVSNLEAFTPELDLEWEAPTPLPVAKEKPVVSRIGASVLPMDGNGVQAVGRPSVVETLGSPEPSRQFSPAGQPSVKQLQLMGLPSDETERNAVLRRRARKFRISEEAVFKCYQEFCNADRDGSGFVDVFELRSLLEATCCRKLSDQEFEKIMLTCDRDGDRRLHFEEFLQAYCTTPMIKTQVDIANLGQDLRAAVEEDRMTPAERVRTRGIPKHLVIEYLREEMSEAEACIGLPSAVLLFVLFVLSYLSHFPVERLHANDRAITYDIYERATFGFSGAVPFESGRMGNKDIEDVNNIEDFWSWLNLGLVPLFFPEGKIKK